MKTLVWLFLVFPCLAHAGPDLVLDTGRSARATFPRETVEGKIYLQTAYAPKDRALPLRRCVLIQGYGITQDIVDFFVLQVGTGARLVHAFVQAQGKTAVRAVAEAYTGGEFLIDRLRKEACQEVVMTVQETTQSTLFEMTERTEQLLENLCGPDLRVSFAGQKKCALIGHSKGGATASLIARRCGDKTGMTEATCRNLSEVYTSASAEGGIGLSALILGAKLEKKQSLATDFFKVFRLGGSDKLVDTFSDLSAATNPSWFDLSPLAEADNKMAQAVRFASPIRLDGWFHGELAASAGEFDFSRPGTIGTGTKGRPDTAALARLSQTGQDSEFPLIQSIGKIAQTAKKWRERSTIMSQLLDEMATRFSQAPAMLHASENRPLFERGVADFKRKAGSRELGALLDLLTWDRFQLSDGLVESDGALNTCRQVHAGTRRERERCRRFSGGGINHFAMAGYADEVVSHLVFELVQ